MKKNVKCIAFSQVKNKDLTKEKLLNNKDIKVKLQINHFLKHFFFYQLRHIISWIWAKGISAS